MLPNDATAVQAAHESAQVTVHSSEELAAALETLEDGGTIYLAPSDEPYEIDIQGLQASADQAIRLTSLDPDTPAEVQDVLILDSSHISLDTLNISSGEHGAERADWLSDVYVGNSNNISLANLTMEGTADGLLDRSGTVEQAEDAISISNSSDILVADNTISNYYHGVSIVGVEQAEVSGNDISALQGDGIRGGGVKDVTVSDNYIHDFLGATYDINHPDMIQFWTRFPDGVTNENILITDNILDTGQGAATQGILVQNEGYGIPGDPLEGVLSTGVTISNNVIHTGMHLGIHVKDYADVEVSDNTVLWNQGAGIVEETGQDPISYEPWILVRNSEDVALTNNISGEILIDHEDASANNTKLDYLQESDPHYAFDHFIGLSSLGTSDPAALQLRPDSPLNGEAGSTLSTWQASDEAIDPVITAGSVAEDRTAVLFSAEYSTVNGSLADLEDTQFLWTFDDGSSAEGTDVVVSFETPGVHEATLQIIAPDGSSATETLSVWVDSNTILTHDFETNTPQDSDGIVVEVFDPNETAAATEGQFVLDGESHYRLDTKTEELASLDVLSIDVDFTPTEFNENEGWLVYWTNGIDIRITEEGGLWATVDTDEGQFEVRSDSNVLHVGQQSVVTATFDGPAGTFSVMVDGVVVGEAEASGTTNANTHQVILGNAYTEDTAIGDISNVEISSPQSDAFGALEDTVAIADVTEPESVAPVIEDTPPPASDEVVPPETAPVEDVDEPESVAPVIEDTPPPASDEVVPPETETETETETVETEEDSFTQTKIRQPIFEEAPLLFSGEVIPPETDDQTAETEQESFTHTKIRQPIFKELPPTSNGAKASPALKIETAETEQQDPSKDQDHAEGTVTAPEVTVEADSSHSIFEPFLNLLESFLAFLGMDEEEETPGAPPQNTVTAAQEENDDVASDFNIDDLFLAPSAHGDDLKMAEEEEMAGLEAF